MKQNKRLIERAARKIDRERVKMEGQEKKHKQEITKLAKQGQHAAAKILSKDIVRIRSQVNQYYMMNSQLKAMSMKMSTMSSYQEIVKSLAGSSHVLAQMNEQMDIQNIQQVLKTFQKESMKSELQQEAVSILQCDEIFMFIQVNDAMEMGMGDVDEQADDVYNNILDEIGLEYSESDPQRAKGAIPKKRAVEEEKKQDEADDLEARLAALKM
ncbi:snf7 family protein [Stylonychia lemnae]|uniref:Snf7 family protein n=1 Tax=Stylonychia lemnae TaxID=5949 RepID=A0A078AGV1_STYLE|nr:snf7 family protein [Stylonychia lemnae]|eukprot:CDW81444.1 snf7 family protein [Stylonychia lemnae]